MNLTRRGSKRDRTHSRRPADLPRGLHAGASRTDSPGREHAPPSGTGVRCPAGSDPPVEALGHARERDRGGRERERRGGDGAAANSSSALRRGGVIVLADAAPYSGYRPLSVATAGHPGPSRVAEEVGADEFPEIGSAGHNRVFECR